ncbi:hypothetical protein ACWKSP_22315 [Micromonosporaceae bacterium Da 78-11]
MSAVDDARTEALFLSDLQPSQHPAGALVRAVVDVKLAWMSPAECAAVVAQEYGEHPQATADRMRWAHTAVVAAFEPAHA